MNISWSRKPRASTAKHKLKSLLRSTSTTFPDLFSTSLDALKESADAFPPLKSAVGGVLAIRDIALRAKHSKSDARDIALRTEKILCVIADAVPDASAIPPPMMLSIQCFTDLLQDTRSTMEAMMLSSLLSHVAHLNRNERKLQSIKSRLDDAYRDFLAASALRVEAQQAGIATQLEVQQTQLVVHHNYLAEEQVQLKLGIGKVAVRVLLETPDDAHECACRILLRLTCQPLSFTPNYRFFWPTPDVMPDPTAFYTHD
ncbi:hypothetical protein B0H16DRAFT_1565921, partial [Mycena metata]